MTDPVVCPGKCISLTYGIADESGSILERTDLPVGYIYGCSAEPVDGLDEAVSGGGLH